MSDDVAIFVPTVPARRADREYLLKVLRSDFNNIHVRENPPDETYREQLINGYRETAELYPECRWIIRVEDDGVLAPDYYEVAMRVLREHAHEPIITFHSNLKEDEQMVRDGVEFKRNPPSKIHGNHFLATTREASLKLADWFERDTDWNNKSGFSLGRAVKAGVFGVKSILVRVPSIAQQKAKIKSQLGHGASKHKQSRSFNMVYGEVN